jgi:hypothetical protein
MKMMNKFMLCLVLVSLSGCVADAKSALKNLGGSGGETQQEEKDRKAAKKAEKKVGKNEPN